jgi:lysophospholipase L1-like esterase
MSKQYIRNYLLMLFTFLATICCGQKEVVAAEKFVCIGDSITAGGTRESIGDQDGSQIGGYEPTLARLLIASGRNDALVLNYGHPGETSGDGEERLQGILDREHPAWVLVMEGTNDLWWIDTGSVMVNLASMVNKSRNSGATPVLATITPDTDAGDQKPIPELNDLIRGWTNENNVLLADQYAAVAVNWDNLHIGDGLHPNQAGYDILAQTWFDAITREPVNLKPVNLSPVLLLLLREKPVNLSPVLLLLLRK